MNPKSFITIVSLTLGGLFIAGCGEKVTEDSAVDDLENAINESIKADTVDNEATKETLQQIQNHIPSPIIMAEVISASGASYSPEFLNSDKNIEHYNTNFKKAINLGIYGADLGYTNLNNQTSKSLDYLHAIADLAEDLEVDKFFQFSKILELKDDLDQLINLSQTSFFEMDAYLKEKKQGDISVAILLGGWLEGLHLSSKIAEVSTDATKEILYQSIGDQKVVIPDIQKLMSHYQHNPNFEELIAGLDGIESAYKNVEINYVKTKVEEAPVIEGLPMAFTESEEVEESIITITEQDVQKISNAIENLRTKLIQ